MYIYIYIHVYTLGVSHVFCTETPCWKSMFCRFFPTLVPSAPRNVSEVWIFFVLSFQLLVGFSVPWQLETDAAGRRWVTRKANDFTSMERWWVTENSTGRSKMIGMVTTHVLRRLPHVDVSEMFSCWRLVGDESHHGRVFTDHVLRGIQRWCHYDEPEREAWKNWESLDKIGSVPVGWWGKGTHVTPSERFFSGVCQVRASRFYGMGLS